MLYIAEFSQSYGTGSFATSSFRSFVSGTIAALETVGLVNTYASGTINSSSVDPPTAVDQFRGYAVMQFNDPLQSTAPVFLKVEFGSNNNSVQSAAYAFTVGRQHDGSGTLNFATSRRVAGTNIVSNVQGTSINLFSADMASSGRLSFCISPFGGASRQFGLVLQRTRDVNGQDTTDGVHMVTLSTQTAAAQSFLGTSVTQPVTLIEQATSPNIYVANEGVATVGKTNFTQSVFLVNSLTNDLSLEDVGAMPPATVNVPTFIKLQFGSQHRQFFILPTGLQNPINISALQYIIRAE